MLTRLINSDNVWDAFEKLGEPQFTKFAALRFEIANMFSYGAIIDDYDLALKAVSEKLNTLDRALYKKLTDYLFDTLKSKQKFQTVKIQKNILDRVNASYLSKKTNDPSLTYQTFVAETLERSVSSNLEKLEDHSNADSKFECEMQPKLKDAKSLDTDEQPILVNGGKIGCNGTLQQTQCKLNHKAAPTSKIKKYTTSSGRTFVMTEEMLFFYKYLYQCIFTKSERAHIRQGAMPFTKDLKDEIVQEAYRMAKERLN